MIKYLIIIIIAILSFEALCISIVEPDFKSRYLDFWLILFDSEKSGL